MFMVGIVRWPSGTRRYTTFPVTRIVDDGWVCLNDESLYFEDDLTEYDDICEDWETRE